MIEDLSRFLGAAVVVAIALLAGTTLFSAYLSATDLAAMTVDPYGTSPLHAWLTFVHGGSHVVFVAASMYLAFGIHRNTRRTADRSRRIIELLERQNATGPRRP